MKVDFITTVYQLMVPREIKLNENEKSLIGKEIEQYLKKGIIKRVPYVSEPSKCVSNIFIRPKKDGGIRLVLNLK